MSYGWLFATSRHVCFSRWLSVSILWLTVAGFAQAQNFANTANNLVVNGDFEDISAQATNPGDNPGYPIPSWSIGGASSINLIEVDGTVGNQAGCAGAVQCGPDNDSDPATSISGTTQHYAGIDLGSLDASQSLGISQQFTLLCDTTVTYGGWYATRNETPGSGYVALIPPGLVSFLDVNVVTLAAGDSNTWTNFEKQFALTAGTYELFTQIDPHIAVDDLYVIPDDPCIHLSKTATGVTTALGTDPAVTDAGDTISYDLVVENTSPASAMTNLSVVDPVATTLSCPSTSVAAGASMTCTASVVITTADLTTGYVENSASVTTDTPSVNGAGASNVSDDNGNEFVETPDGAGVMDGNPANDPTVVFLESTPALRLIKTVDTATVVAGSDTLNIDEGDTVTYAFTVTNQGLVPLSNVTVSDPVLGAVSCALTTLDPGESTACTASGYLVLATDVANGYVQNSAVANAEDPLAVVVSDDSDAGNDSVETADGAGTVDGDPTNDPTVLVLTSTGGLRLYKTIGATTVASGPDVTVIDADDTVSFNFTVTNTLPDTVSAIAITDAKLGTVTCASTSLNSGDSTTCSAAPYTVLQGDVDAGFIQNSALVSGTDSALATVTDTSDAGDDSVETEDAVGMIDSDATNDPTVLVLNQSPDLQLFKTITSLSTDKGFDSVNTDAQDEITYAFLVTNTGNVTLTDVDVVDLMLGTVTCATTTLAPGANTTCTGPVYVIQNGDMNAGYVDNSAAATATDSHGKSVQDISDPAADATETGDGLGNVDGDSTNDPTVQQLVQLPAIRVYKTIDTVTTALGTDPSVTDAGDTISYLFEVANTGNVTVQQIAVTDSLVAGITCNFSAVGVGSSTDCSGAPYTITAVDVANGYIENTATGEGRDPVNSVVLDISDAGDDDVETADGTGTTDGDATNDPTIYTFAPRLSVRLYKTIASSTVAAGVDPANVDAGDTITYSFEITNTGSDTLTGVGVTDPLLGSVTCAATTLASAAQTTCTAAPYTVTAADVTAGYVENSAIVSATDSTSGTVTDTSDAGDDGTETPNGAGSVDADASNDPTVFSITPVGTIRLYKTVSAVSTAAGADSTVTDAGDSITYGFALENTGPIDLNSVLVTDAMLGSINCAATTLTAGQSTTCTAAPYTILAVDVSAGFVENSATASALDSVGGVVSDVSDPGNDALETADGSGATDGDPSNDPTVQSILVPGSVRLYKTATDVTTAAGADPGSIDADDTITYSFVVENNGGESLMNIAVTDPMLGTVTCAATTLAPGLTTTCSAAPYTIVQGDMNSGYVENSANVTALDSNSMAVNDISDAGDDAAETADGAGTADSDPTNDPTVVFVGGLASIQLTKTVSSVTTANGADPAQVDAGDMITYLMTVLNTGSVTLSSVSVTDAKLDPVTCTPTSLAPGQSANCTAAPYEISQSDIDLDGAIENSANASALDGKNQPVNDDSDPGDETTETPDMSGNTDGDPTNDPTVYSLVQTRSMRLYKTIGSVTIALGNDPSIIDTGDEIIYDFSVTNTGNVTVENLQITDPLVTVTSCVAGALAPGQTVTCSADAAYVISEADSLAGFVENSATVTGQDKQNVPVADVSDPGDDATESADGLGVTDSDPANDPTVQIIAAYAAVQLYKTIGTVTTALGADSGLTDSGDTISYDFLVTNTGTDTLVNVVVLDSMLGTVSCAATTLAPLAQMACTAASYTILPADVVAGFVENQATVTAQNSAMTESVDDDSDVGDDTIETADGSGALDGDTTNDPTVFAFTPQPDVRLYKVVSAVTVTSGTNPAITDAGDSISYTFTVTNTGATALTSIVVTDPLLDTVSCAASTLAIGASTTCSALPYSITTADMNAGTVENSAGVTVQDANASIALDISDAGDDSIETPNADGTVDGDGTNDPTVQPLTASPGLRLTKQISATTTALGSDAFMTDAGDTITYSFILTNTGNVSVTGLVINDPLLSAVTCATTTLAAGATTGCNAAPYSITTVDVSAGYVQNSATVSGTAASGGPVSDVSDAGDENTETPDGAGATDGDSTNDPTVQEFSGAEYDLALIKTLASNQPAWVLTNDVIDYVILIQNQGNVPSRTFTVTDTIPAGMSYVAGSAAGSGFGCIHDGSTSGGLLTCVYTPPTTNDLAPGATTELTLSLEIVNMTFATFVNWAEISADSSAAYGVSDQDSAPGDHGASDNGPGGGSHGANPVIDHDDISHSDSAWNDASEDEDDSDPATVYSAASTPVTLQSFRATNNGDAQIMVRWRTSMEEANVGYHVFGLIGGGWSQLNERLIAATADADNGASYAHRFDRKGATEFVLADVDANGKITPHGPFSAGRLYGFEDADNTPPPGAGSTSSPETSNPETSDPDAQLSNLANDEAHLIVREVGIQRVSYTQLSRAGFDLGGIPASKLAIHVGNRELPIWIGTADGAAVTSGAFRPGHVVEFYADEAETRYRSSLVYRLSVADDFGLRAKVETTTRRPRASQSAMREKIWSPDHSYSRVAPGDDPWYAFRLTASRESVSRRVVLSLDNVKPLARRAAVLKLKLWGASDDPKVAVDHNVTIKFNNLQYTTMSFGGIESREIEMQIAPEIVQAGRNVVEISASADGHTSAIAVESIALTYAGTTTLANGSATLIGSAAGYRFRNVDSDDAVIWRIDNAGTTRISPYVLPRAEGRYDLESAASTDRDARHVVALRRAINRPGVRRAPVIGDLVQGPADYLIVSHPRFLTPGGSLERLIRRREADGLSVKTVNVNWIYSALSGGNVDAEAIREYIGWARENLGTRYALLVGGDTYDYKKNLRKRTGQIAQSLIPTLYGKTAEIINHAPVDPLFGDVDNDGVPDVAVGRFPVQTEAELLIMVRKTLQYTRANYGETALFLADSVDAGSQRSFADDAHALASKLPESWQASVVDLQSATPGVLRSSAVSAVNRGVALTTWIGHSGQNTWSFNRVLRSADIAGLSNTGRPTVVAQFGCWNSYHVDPRRRTMAHHWLLQPERGAAAVMGASTLTDATAEGLLSDALFRILARDNLTLGEALIKAKRVLAENHPIDRVRDILSGYQLLGDPAMRLPQVSNKP